MDDLQKNSYSQKRRKRKRKRSFRRLCRCILIWGIICFFAYIVCETECGIWLQNVIEQQYDARLLNSKNTAVISMEQLQTHVNSIAIEQELSELLEKNKEAKDFVENYANRAQYLGRDIDLSEDFSEGEVPLLMQWDLRWGYEAFGDSIIGLSGCGPTCLSMAYVYFTEDMTGNPKEMGAFCEKNGYYTSLGTSWDLWTKGVEELGLSGKELSLDEKVMKAALDEGGLIICSMRPGDFTSTGHYILIYGYGADGFCVKDPNRNSNSEKEWSYDVLRGQIKNLWVIHKA